MDITGMVLYSVGSYSFYPLCYFQLVEAVAELFCFLVFGKWKQILFVGFGCVNGIVKVNRELSFSFFTEATILFLLMYCCFEMDFFSFRIKF